MNLELRDINNSIKFYVMLSIIIGQQSEHRANLVIKTLKKDLLEYGLPEKKINELFAKNSNFLPSEFNSIFDLKNVNNYN